MHRVLLDTNVWNYLADTNTLEKVRRVTKTVQVQIAVAPAAVYESMRVGDPILRRRRARGLARNAWLRLMPEAFSECADLREALKRLRPEWLAKSPDLRQWFHQKADWEQGFWRRIRTDPTLMARVIGNLGDKELQRARAETKAARTYAIEQKQTLETFSWNRATAVFSGPMPGWDGEEFDAWRGISCAHWWDALVMGRSPTTMDWLAPFVNLPAIRSDQASWTQFWTREIESVDVPRDWIRWVMFEVQATRKTSAGAPGDNQLATYLVDADSFVTSDGVFADLVEAMRPHSPVSLARTERCPAGASAAEFVIDLLHSVDGA